MKRTIIFAMCPVFLLFVLCSCGDPGREKETDADAVVDGDGIAQADEDLLADDADPLPAAITFTPEGEEIVLIEGGGHYAFPDIVRRADGSLFVAYRFGSSHADNGGRLLFQTGSADGAVWSDPSPLVNTAGLDDRDPSLTVLSDGRIALNWFEYYFTDDPTVQPYAHHVFTAFSSDGGASFSEGVQVDPGPLDYAGATIDEEGIWRDAEGAEVLIMACSSPMIEHDGALLLPLYGGNALNYTNFSLTPHKPIALGRSDDGGQTWSSAEIAGNDDDLWLMEPAILDIGGTRMIMQVRSAAGSSPSNKGKLLQSVSTDGGATWSAYTELPFIAHAPELVKLGNGVIVSAFRWLNDSYTAENVSFVYSLDGGATWSDLVIVRDCGAAECGYPGIVELPGNRILIVYYLPGGAGIAARMYSFSAS